MKNPLTRGKGVKAIKIVKTLIGTNSFYDVILKAQMTAGHQLQKSPERGLGHIIREGRPRPGVRMRERQIGNIGSLTGSTTGHEIMELMTQLFPCLYIGCAIWWASDMPDIIQSLKNLISIIDREDIFEELRYI